MNASLLLRCSLAAALATSVGAQIAQLSLVVPGCTGSPADLSIALNSPTGVDFFAENSAVHPTVLVIGFTNTSLLLPAVGVGPCLLLPSPDVLWLMPPNQFVNVAIPPGTAPGTAWIQAVEVRTSGLFTTNGFQLTVS